MDDLKTSEAWRIFRIQAELIDGIETLNDLGPAVSIFGGDENLDDEIRITVIATGFGENEVMQTQPQASGAATRGSVVTPLRPGVRPMIERRKAYNFV